jgi:hypothetical protein
MYRKELIYFIVLSIIILFSNMLPTFVLLSLDSIIIRIAIVLLLLYLISIGPTAGIFGLVAVGVLYLERNRRKIVVARKKLDAMDVNQPAQMSVDEERIPQKSVPVLPFEIPRGDEMTYMPSDEMGSDHFEQVAPSINSKEVLQSIYEGGEGAGSDKLYEELGFGHIEGVETL